MLVAGQDSNRFTPSERFEDLGLQKHVERLARQLFDDVALDVDARSVPKVAAWLDSERQLGQLVDHLLEVGIVPCRRPISEVDIGIFIPSGIVEAGRAAHELPHRHRADPRHLAARCGHLEVGELGDALGHGVVEQLLALRRGEEHRVTGDRLLGRQILDAVRVEVNNLTVPCNERRDTGELALVHQRTHRSLERFSSRRSKIGFRGHKRILRPAPVNV